MCSFRWKITSRVTSISTRCESGIATRCQKRHPRVFSVKCFLTKIRVCLVGLEIKRARPSRSSLGPWPVTTNSIISSKELSSTSGMSSRTQHCCMPSSRPWARNRRRMQRICRLLNSPKPKGWWYRFNSSTTKVRYRWKSLLSWMTAKVIFLEFQGTSSRISLAKSPSNMAMK